MMIMVMIMIMINNLYSTRTLKHSKKFHTMRKSKKSKILYKIKITIFKALNFRVILVKYKLS